MFSQFSHARSSSRVVKLAYRCLLAILCWILISPPASQAVRYVPQVQSRNWTSTEEQIFVIYRNERGEFACRDATKTERERINERRGGGPTRLIYEGAGRQKSTSGTQRSTSTFNLLPSAGLRIVLHGTTQLEQNLQAKNAFIVAANRWEALITTPITIVLDVDFGPTFFGQPYDDPHILGATASSSTTGPFSDLRQRLISGASTAAETQIYNALPTSVVPIELDGSVSSVSDARLTLANARALGIVPNITNPESRS